MLVEDHNKENNASSLSNPTTLSSDCADFTQFTTSNTRQPLSMSVSDYKTFATESDGRCFFRSAVISMNNELQEANRNEHGIVIDNLSLVFKERIAADSLRAQVVNFMSMNSHDYNDLDSGILNADMPHENYNTIFDRLEDMSKPNTMIGEMEIAATVKVLDLPIIVMNISNGAVLKYGVDDLPSPPIILKFQYIGDNAGHYECLLHKIDTQADHVPIKAISPLPIKTKTISKKKNRTQQSEILTSSPYKKRLVESNSSKSKKENTKKKARNVFDNSAPSKKAKKNTIKISKKTKEKGESWYCFICDENLQEDMVQCSVCDTWVHAACAGSESDKQYTCVTYAESFI